jgi:phosphoribosylformylglycinamidine synthase
VDGGAIWLLGPRGAGLGGSLWALTAHGHRGGLLPPLDLDVHHRLVDLVCELASGGLAQGIHDVGEGGLGVALAEMAVRAAVGFRVTGVQGHGELFSEAPSRVVLCVAPGAAEEEVRRAAGAAGLPLLRLGEAGGDRLVVEGLVDLGLAKATERWRAALPALLGH